VSKCREGMKGKVTKEERRGGEVEKEGNWGGLAKKGEGGGEGETEGE